MNTPEIKVTTQGVGMEEALTATEKPSLLWRDVWTRSPPRSWRRSSRRLWRM